MFEVIRFGERLGTVLGRRNCETDPAQMALVKQAAVTRHGKGVTLRRKV